MEVTLNAIDFLTGKMHKSYFLEKCLYNPFAIMWSPVALGAEMKSTLSMSNKITPYQIQLVKYLSTALGSLITVFSGKFYLYLILKFLLLFLSYILLFCSVVLFVIKSIDTRFFLGEIIIILIAILLSRKRIKPSKISFILLFTSLTFELVLLFSLLT